MDPKKQDHNRHENCEIVPGGIAQGECSSWKEKDDGARDSLFLKFLDPSFITTLISECRFTLLIIAVES